MLLMLGGLHEAPPETLGCMWKSLKNYNYDVAGNGEMRIFFLMIVRFYLFRLKILLSSLLDVYRLFGYIDTWMYV